MRPPGKDKKIKGKQFIVFHRSIYRQKTLNTEFLEAIELT